MSAARGGVAGSLPDSVATARAPLFPHSAPRDAVSIVRGAQIEQMEDHAEARWPSPATSIGVSERSRRSPVAPRAPDVVIAWGRHLSFHSSERRSPRAGAPRSSGVRYGQRMAIGPEPVAHRPPPAPAGSLVPVAVALGTLASASMRVGVACLLPATGRARLTMNSSGLDSILLSSVQMAPLRVAVLGDAQLDGDVAVGVRFDDDLPADVAGRVQPPGPDHRACLSPWTPWMP